MITFAIRKHLQPYFLPDAYKVTNLGTRVVVFSPIEPGTANYRKELLAMPGTGRIISCACKSDHPIRCPHNSPLLANYPHCELATADEKPPKDYPYRFLFS